jgi:hypothetical protein
MISEMAASKETVCKRYQYKFLVHYYVPEHNVDFRINLSELITYKSVWQQETRDYHK